MMKKYDLKGIERRLSTYVFLICDVGGYLHSQEDPIRLRRMGMNCGCR